MANHFKNYQAQIRRTKNNEISAEDLEKFSNTVNNAGVTHEHKEWDKPIQEPSVEENPESAESWKEKEKTIKRNIEREQKSKEHTEDFVE